MQYFSKWRYEYRALCLCYCVCVMQTSVVTAKSEVKRAQFWLAVIAASPSSVFWQLWPSNWHSDVEHCSNMYLIANVKDPYKLFWKNKRWSLQEKLYSFVKFYVVQFIKWIIGRDDFPTYLTTLSTKYWLNSSRLSDGTPLYIMDEISWQEQLLS